MGRRLELLIWVLAVVLCVLLAARILTDERACTERQTLGGTFQLGDRRVECPPGEGS